MRRSGWQSSSRTLAGFRSRWTMPLLVGVVHGPGQRLDQLGGRRRGGQRRAVEAARPGCRRRRTPGRRTAGRRARRPRRSGRCSGAAAGRRPRPRCGTASSVAGAGVLAGQDHLEGDEPVQAESAGPCRRRPCRRGPVRRGSRSRARGPRTRRWSPAAARCPGPSWRTGRAVSPARATVVPGWWRAGRPPSPVRRSWRCGGPAAGRRWSAVPGGAGPGGRSVFARLVGHRPALMRGA